MKKRGIRVLAISQNPRGYGFAIFEGPAAPVEWGIRKAGKKERIDPLATARELIEWYEPDVLVTENGRGPGSNRGEEVLSRLRSVVALVRRKRLRTERYSRKEVRACFSKYGAKTKEEIAAVIARELHELAPKLPGKRKPWKSEDERLWIFDAASLALTFFFCESKREEE